MADCLIERINVIYVHGVSKYAFQGKIQWMRILAENGKKGVKGNRAMGLDRGYPIVFSYEIIIRASLPE